jgi:uncharacterized protein YjiS (DUF1127 family)
MTALDLATDTTRAAGRTTILARGLNTVSKFVRAWRNRRAFYRLSDMTDSELRDIGLTRADLHVAVTSPFGLDPTTRLRAIVDARAEEA